MKRPIINIAPVKNEEWVIKHFIDNIFKWADQLIIADQNSTDKTLAIIHENPLVRVISNTSNNLDENYRKNLLLATLRSKFSNSIIFGIDADEFLSPEALQAENWKNIYKLSEGTIITLDWYNILPDLKHCWIEKDKIFGFVDNNTTFSESGSIHLNRVPVPEDATIYHEKKFAVIHLQYIDWDRMRSKHCWYQCWERITYPDKSSISIYRQYHHMYALNKKRIVKIPKKWLDSFKIQKISLDNIKYKSKGGEYWWDLEVVKMFSKYGTNVFAREDIWGIDWQAIAIKHHIALVNIPTKSISTMLLHGYLSLSQSYSNTNIVKLFDRILIMIFKI